MSYTPLSEPIEQYRNGDLTLTQAASEADLTAEEFGAELRSRGIDLREDDQSAVTTTRY